MTQMTLNEYQEKQRLTARYSTPMYPFGSIAEEAGEVMGKLNKYTRKHKVSYERALGNARDCQYGVSSLHAHFAAKLRDDLIAELGDVLWQVSAAAGELGCTLEEIALANNKKLLGRQERDTLVGEGDDR